MIVGQCQGVHICNYHDAHYHAAQYLNTHLRNYPALLYAGWVELALMALEDRWNRESTVADRTFYEEEGMYLNLQNKPMLTETTMVTRRRRGRGRLGTTSVTS